MRLPAPVRASEVAAITGATLVGPDCTLTGVAPVNDAEGAELAFLDRGDPGQGVHFARGSLGGTTLVTPDPLAAFVAFLVHTFPGEGQWAPHDTTDPASLTGAIVHPGVVIGPGCEVGAGTVLFPNVVLYPGTKIGRNCRIHAGTVIGADGFRYHPTATGLLRVPHVAGVTIGDGVELGPSCTIDRGFLEDTRIGDGCRLDALVHIGHNVTLGRFVIIAAQTGISGSVRVGDGAVLGGQVGVADHAEIGANARIGAQSGIHGTIPAGESWLGTPALPLATMRRVYAVMRYLPDLWRQSR